MRPFLAAAGAALALAGCQSSKPAVSSQTSSVPPSNLSIDGDAAEWQGRLRALPGTSGASMAVSNDAQNLYVALYVTDATLQRQILGDGFVLWLDKQGGQQKRVGLRFPLGGRPGRGGMDGPRGGSRGEAQERPERPERPQPGQGNAPPSRERPGLPPDAFESAEWAWNGQTTGVGEPMATLTGVHASVQRSGGALVYEVQIPLVAQAEGGPAVGVQRGTVGVGFQALAGAQRPSGGRPDGPQGGGRGGMGGPPSGGGMQGGGPPGGMQGIGGGPGGERGGPPSGERTAPKAWEQWVRLTLAP